MRLTLALVILGVIFSAVTMATPKLRFDSFNIWGCPKDDPGKSLAISPTCDPEKRVEQHTSKQYCMCGSDLQALASTGNHYIAYDENNTQFLNDIKSTGNRMAWMIDGFATFFQERRSGTAYADALWELAQEKFKSAPQGMPKFWILNELSEHNWFSNVHGYHQYALDVVKRLRTKYHVTPVMCSPSMMIHVATNPSDRDFGVLAKYAYIGVEAYVSSLAVKKNKYSVSWLHGQYVKSVQSYQQAGVPKSKLIMLEDYSTTPKGTGWGSGGLPQSQWLKVVTARGKAMQHLGVAGTGSYGWSSYWNDTPAQRATIYAAYNKYAKHLP